MKKKSTSRFASHVFYIDADVARRRRQTGNCHLTSASFLYPFRSFVVVIVYRNANNRCCVVVIQEDEAKLCCCLTVVLSFGAVANR